MASDTISVKDTGPTLPSGYGINQAIAKAVAKNIVVVIK
jgi:hypothetical protein